MSMKRFLSTFVFTLLLATVAAAQNPADIGKGKQLFEGLCSRCHGFEGTGGEGPNLNRPTLTRAQNDESLVAIIRDGIPERGMPRVRRTTDNEQRQLAAYVRSLGRAVRTASSGNAEKGSAVYQRNGCTTCHVINGQGGVTGPELTVIGTQRGPAYLRQAVLDPASALPRGVQQIPARNLSEFLSVRVVTREGKELRGVRINEDSFTIQVRDANNVLYSLRKADLKEIEKEFGKSLMPAYKDRLAAADADDLVAYLSSLGGAK